MKKQEYVPETLDMRVTALTTEDWKGFLCTLHSWMCKIDRDTVSDAVGFTIEDVILKLRHYQSMPWTEEDFRVFTQDGDPYCWE